jgi:hypothetical protein
VPSPLEPVLGAAQPNQCAKNAGHFPPNPDPLARLVSGSMPRSCPCLPRVRLLAQQFVIELLLLKHIFALIR